MITVPAGVRIHLALEPTDMRKGFDGLALQVQEVLRVDPFSGHLFIFRGKRAGTVKILFHDGNGMCLFARRLDAGDLAPKSVDPVMPCNLHYSVTRMLLS